MQNTALTVIGLIVIGIGAFFLTQHNAARVPESAMHDDAMMADAQHSAMDDTAMHEGEDAGAMRTEGSPEAMSAGSYEAYAPEKLAKAEAGKVVLFFRASWCPTCRALDADIRSHLAEIPTGVTILDVDYDTAGALKQKYGVTYQHTLVQVDAQGTQLAKWAGSPTLAELATHVI